MNVLVVGSGGREHAICWKLLQSPRIRKLFTAPGNAGTAEIATNVPVSATDIDGLIEAVKKYKINLTIVGPELPLAYGIVDRFEEIGFPVFGPTKAAAQIEASKVFAKELMRRYHLPSAHSVAFDSSREAIIFIERREPPIVVKADGLAAGKGVTVAATRADAVAAVRACLDEHAFGDSGNSVLIEEYLEGREVSVFTFTDGETLSPPIAACDYKRAQDNDYGANTGGMGSYSPPEFWNSELAREVELSILQPTVKAMAMEGSPYAGVLYGGLILTAQGPKIIEFNCRLGDPEAQVILPRLKTDLLEIVEAVSQKQLTETFVEWSTDACVGIVIASKGYPGKFEQGLPISGLNPPPKEAMIFHAGTKLAQEMDASSSRVVTDGGRVLTVVGKGPSIEEARLQAYSAAPKVTFPGSFYRNDIALRLKRNATAIS